MLYIHPVLVYPTSKAATVEYLKNHFDEDVDLSKIYRYLDKLAEYIIVNTIETNPVKRAVQY